MSKWGDFEGGKNLTRDGKLIHKILKVQTKLGKVFKEIKGSNPKNCKVIFKWSTNFIFFLIQWKNKRIDLQKF